MPGPLRSEARHPCLCTMKGRFQFVANFPGCQCRVRFPLPQVIGWMNTRFACGNVDTFHFDDDLAQTKADKVMPHLVGDLCHLRGGRGSNCPGPAGGIGVGRIASRGLPGHDRILYVPGCSGGLHVEVLTLFISMATSPKQTKADKLMLHLVGDLCH